MRKQAQRGNTLGLDTEKVWKRILETKVSATHETPSLRERLVPLVGVPSSSLFSPY